MNGTINVALCGEMNYRVDCIVRKYRFNNLLIADVPFHKKISWILFNVDKICRVSRIGYRIKIGDRAIRMHIEHMPDKIAADKSKTARNQKFQTIPLQKRLSMF